MNTCVLTKGLEQYRHQHREDTETADTPAAEDPADTESTDDPTDQTSLEFDTPDEAGSEVQSFAQAIELTARNGGTVTDDVRAYLKDKHGFSDEDIGGYFETTVKERIQTEVNKALKVVGGQDNYKKLNAWVQKNKTPEQIAAINEAVASPVTRDITLRGLMAEAEIQVTTSKQINPTGQPNGQSAVTPYASQAELNADLVSPEIKDRFHPNYQEKVIEIQRRN